MIEDLKKSGVMEVTELNDRFSIGAIVHGSELTAVIEGGGLESMLQSLTYDYRDVYGRVFWNEYLVCSDQYCGKKIGLGKKENLKERDNYFLAHGNEFCCPDCESPMIFFHGPEKTKRAIAAAFRDKIFASLAFDRSQNNEKLVGFALGVETTIGDGYKDKINTGPNDSNAPELTYEEYLADLRSGLGSCYEERHPAFQIAEWGMLTDYRKFGISIPMLYKLYTLANERMSKKSIHPIPIVVRTITPMKNLFESLGGVAGRPYGEGELRFYSTLPAAIQKIDKLNNHD